MIQMDGVSVTPLKNRLGIQGCYLSKFAVPRESTRFIDSLPSASQQEPKVFYMVVDPGKRDILCCIYADPLFKRRFSIKI